MKTKRICSQQPAYKNVKELFRLPRKFQAEMTLHENLNYCGTVKKENTRDDNDR